MNRLTLMLPMQQHKEAVWSYREEFLRNHSSMDGTGGLADAQSFEEWYRNTVANRTEETVRPGLVPATTFLALEVSSGELVGMIDIRHRLNDHLLNFGGHIGYSVRPSCRRKGYATEGAKAMADYAFALLGAKRIVCDIRPMNVASIAVAKRIGMVKTGSFVKNYRGKRMEHLIFELRCPEGDEKI